MGERATPFESDALIAGVFVGLPRLVGVPDAATVFDRSWTTGYYKRRVIGPVHVGALNLDGDGQADLTSHGGPDKAVLAYAAGHYPQWQSELEDLMDPDLLKQLGPGGFGENLVVTAWKEEDVAIGDVHRIGTAMLQVTQPRSPCWKIARRWRLHCLAARVQQSARTGWYYRVLETGHIGEGDVIRVEDRPFAQWTVARVSRLRHSTVIDHGALASLIGCDALASRLRTTLQLRLEQGQSRTDSARLVGPNALHPAPDRTTPPGTGQLEQ